MGGEALHIILVIVCIITTGRVMKEGVGEEQGNDDSK
jgi:hypothetical protein